MLQEYKVIDKKHGAVAIFIDDEQRAIEELQAGNKVFVRPTFTRDGGQEWREFNGDKDLRSIDEKRLERLNKNYHKKNPLSYKNRQQKQLIKYSLYKKIKQIIRFDDKLSNNKIAKELDISHWTVAHVRKNHEKYSDYLIRYNEEIKSLSNMYCDKPIIEKTVRSAKIRWDNNLIKNKEK